MGKTANKTCVTWWKLPEVATWFPWKASRTVTIGFFTADFNLFLILSFSSESRWCSLTGFQAVNSWGKFWHPTNRLWSRSLPCRQAGSQEECRRSCSKDPVQSLLKSGMREGTYCHHVAWMRTCPGSSSHHQMSPKCNFLYFFFCSAFAKVPPASVAVEVSLHLTALEQLLHFSFPFLSMGHSPL